MEFGNDNRSLPLTPEILKKIRHVELRTKKILRGSMLGDYTTKQKGFGLEFDQLSEYQFGDDIRFIDWKSSARMTKLLVKEYHEERNRTIMLLVDGSTSHLFGSQEQQKNEYIAEVATVIALAGQHQKDQIGLVIFTDEIEAFAPPKSGAKHMQAIIQKLFTFKPQKKRTKLSSGLNHLMKVQRRDTLTFLLSDFIDDGFEKELKMASKTHDIVAIRCMDRFEQALPHVGFVHVQDIETGRPCVLNTNDKYVRAQFAQRERSLEKLVKKNKISKLDLSLGTDYMDTLIPFLIKRIRQ